MAPKINVIPEPVHWKLTGGQFSLSPNTPVFVPNSAEKAAASLEQSLSPAVPLIRTKGALPEESPAGIAFRLDTSLSRLGPEGYRLTVTPEQVELRAPQGPGLFYAVQTLRQLLPPEAFGSQGKAKAAWAIPCIEVEDTPRFAWRGAMLDVARHFMPTSFLLKFIDLLALHKLNTFHLHLTDDQGWRIEIKKHPRLTGVGAWRKETMIGRLGEGETPAAFDGIPHGGFYSQEEVQAVVAYARDRFVNIVPEIEMPGHCQAALAAYPELGNTLHPLEVSTRWGIHEDVYNVEESTFAFLEEVLSEVLELFPGPFIHLGGDEVPKTQWRQTPAAQNRLRELGLQDEQALQSYFIRRMDAFLAGRGRRLVGWDEILEGGLAPGATVMSWRGEQGGITAAIAGHDVVMAPNHYTYLDYYQSEDREREPLAIGGFLPLEKVYQYEPVPPAIPPERASHVLGAQAQLWTEYMPDPQRVETMAFPRLCALAEVAWTLQERKDLADFIRRLPVHLQRLDRLGVRYRPLET